MRSINSKGLQCRPRLRPVRTGSALIVLSAVLWTAAATARPVPTPVPAVVFDEPAVVFDGPELMFDETWPTAQTVQRGQVSLREATALAQRRFPGRVARAETVTTGNRRVHVIRILGDDGRVRTVRVDAETGNFL